ncbi:MAG: response regulator [Nannocystales bacterium]
MSTVLFAHERPSVARAVTHVLEPRGFEVDSVRDGDAAAAALRARRYAALVVDVALPGRPGYELVDLARAEADDHGCGAQVVVLVASVFRKTSYKRRPARLYGADDYVELHHLGDLLPEKLASHLGIDLPGAGAEAGDESAEAVYEIAEDHMDDQSSDELASLIVGDVVLYNGESIAGTSTLSEARAALADDLEVARDLLRQVYASRGDDTDAAAALERSFRNLMHTMGRREASA